MIYENCYSQIEKVTVFGLFFDLGCVDPRPTLLVSLKRNRSTDKMDAI